MAPGAPGPARHAWLLLRPGRQPRTQPRGCHRGLGRCGGGPRSLPSPGSGRLLLPPSPRGGSSPPRPGRAPPAATPARSAAGAEAELAPGGRSARPRAGALTPAPGAPPALPARAPPGPLPSPPHRRRGQVPPRLQPVPGADLLTGANAGDCFAALPPPGAGSLPACVRPVPGLEGSLSVPPTAAPAAPPRRPPAAARGERTPGGCRPPPSRPSRPAAPPAAKHTDLPPHPGFPRLFRGSRWPGGRRVSQRASSRGGCPNNRSFKQSGDPGTSQLRPARPGEGQPVPHRKPRPGGTGGGGGKGEQSGEPRLEPGTLQDGGDRRRVVPRPVPPVPRRAPPPERGDFPGRLLPAAARGRGFLAGPEQARSPPQPLGSLL